MKKVILKRANELTEIINNKKEIVKIIEKNIRFVKLKDFIKIKGKIKIDEKGNTIDERINFNISSTILIIELEKSLKIVNTSLKRYEIKFNKL